MKTSRFLLPAVIALLTPLGLMAMAPAYWVGNNSTLWDDDQNWVDSNGNSTVPQSGFPGNDLLINNSTLDGSADYDPVFSDNQSPYFGSVNIGTNATTSGNLTLSNTSMGTWADHSVWAQNGTAQVSLLNNSHFSSGSYDLLIAENTGSYANIILSDNSSIYGNNVSIAQGGAADLSLNNSTLSAYRNITIAQNGGSSANVIMDNNSSMFSQSGNITIARNPNANATLTLDNGSSIYTINTSFDTGNGVISVGEIYLASDGNAQVSLNNGSSIVSAAAMGIATAGYANITLSGDSLLQSKGGIFIAGQATTAHADIHLDNSTLSTNAGGWYAGFFGATVGSMNLTLANGSVAELGYTELVTNTGSSANIHLDDSTLNTHGGAIIAANGSLDLTLANGSQINGAYIELATNLGSSANVSLSGNSHIHTTGSNGFLLGYSGGNSTLSLSGNSTLSHQGSIQTSNHADAHTSITVTNNSFISSAGSMSLAFSGNDRIIIDNSSYLQSGGSFQVGWGGGSANISLSNNSNISGSGVEIAPTSSSFVNLDISGNSSLRANSGFLNIGFSGGSANISLANNSHMSGSGVEIAPASSSFVNLDISGNSSLRANSGFLNIGFSGGSANISLANNSHMSGSGVEIAPTSSSFVNLDISGNSSLRTNSDALNIGVSGGSANISLANNSHMSGSGVEIAPASSSTVNLDISNGSYIEARHYLAFGYSGGKANVTLSNNSHIQAATHVDVAGSGILNITDNSYINANNDYLEVRGNAKVSLAGNSSLHSADFFQIARSTGDNNILTLAGNSHIVSGNFISLAAGGLANITLTGNSSINASTHMDVGGNAWIDTGNATLSITDSTLQAQYIAKGTGNAHLTLDNATFVATADGALLRNFADSDFTTLDGGLSIDTQDNIVDLSNKFSNSNATLSKLGSGTLNTTVADLFDELAGVHIDNGTLASANSQTIRHLTSTEANAASTNINLIGIDSDLSVHSGLYYGNSTISGNLIKETDATLNLIGGTHTIGDHAYIDNGTLSITDSTLSAQYIAKSTGNAHLTLDNATFVATADGALLRNFADSDFTTLDGGLSIDTQDNTVDLSNKFSNSNATLGKLGSGTLNATVANLFDELAGVHLDNGTLSTTTTQTIYHLSSTEANAASTNINLIGIDSDLTVHSGLYYGNSTIGGNFVKEGDDTLSLANGTHTANRVYANNGTLALQNDTRLVNEDYSLIANDAGSNATVTLSDNVRWIANNEFWVGKKGNATLILSGDAMLSNTRGGSFIGGDTGSNGRAQVSGNASWEYTDTLTVGSSGNGSLSISGNGLVSGDSGLIGVSGTGQVQVSDNASWESTSFIIVGVGHNGSLTISDNALVSASSVNLGGASPTGNGTLILNGGTLETSDITKGTGNASFTANGGTLRAKGDGTFFEDFAASDITLGDGGLTIDTQGFTSDLAVALSNANATVIKAGSGTLNATLADQFINLNGVHIDNGTLSSTLDQSVLKLSSNESNAGSTLIDLGTKNLTVSSGDYHGNITAGNLIKTGQASDILKLHQIGALGDLNTLVNNGTLKLDDINGYTGSTLNITLGSGSVLDLSDNLLSGEENANHWDGLNITNNGGTIIGANDFIKLTQPGDYMGSLSGGIYVLVDVGAGNATALTQASDYMGYTRIDSGTLQISDSNQLGNASLAREVILNGGNLHVTDTVQFLQRTLELRDSGVLTIDDTKTNSWKHITENGTNLTLTRNGNGTLQVFDKVQISHLDLQEGQSIFHGNVTLETLRTGDNSNNSFHGTETIVNGNVTLSGNNSFEATQGSNFGGLTTSNSSLTIFKGLATQVNGSVALSGNATFDSTELTLVAGDLDAAAGSASAFNSEQMIVFGNITLQGNASFSNNQVLLIGNDLSTTNGSLTTITSNSVQIGGQVTLNGEIAFEGDATIYGDLIANANTTFNGDSTTIEGDAIINAEATFNSSGNTTLESDLIITSTGNATFNGNITTINGDAIIDGKALFASTDNTTLNSDLTITSTGNATFNTGYLYVEDGTRIDGRALFLGAGYNDLGGLDIGVTGNAIFNTETTEIYSDSNIEGSATFNGNITLFYSTLSTGAASNLTLSSNLTAIQNATLSGSTRFLGDANIEILTTQAGANTTLNGNLSIGSSATLRSDITGSGSLNITATAFGNATALSVLSVNLSNAGLFYAPATLGNVHNTGTLVLPANTNSNIASLSGEDGHVYFGDPFSLFTLQAMRAPRAPVINTTHTFGSLAGSQTFNNVRVNLATGAGDHIRVTGDASGSHQINIVNTAPDQKPKVDAIHLVSITGNTTATFNGHIDADIHRYTMVTTNSDWHLKRTGYSAAGQSAINAIGSMSMGWFQQLDNLNRRMGELRLMHNIGSREPEGPNGWFRAYTARTDVDLEISDVSKFKETLYGSDAGADWSFRPDSYSTRFLGFFIGYQRSSRDIKDVFGTSGDTDNIYAGLYMAYINNDGWYADANIKLQHFSNSYQAHGDNATRDSDYNTQGAGLNLELGRQWQLDRDWFIEPSAQVSYLHLDGKTDQNAFGLMIDTKDADILQLAAAIRMGRTIETAGGSLFQPYYKLGFVRQSSSGGDIRISGQRWDPNTDGTRFQGSVGLIWQPNDRTQFHFDYEATWGDKYDRPYAITAGVRRKF